MPVTSNYNRPKSTLVNSTGMVFSLLASDKPDAPADISGTGTTANLDCRLQCDANESGSADVQDIFKLETAISLDATTGLITWTVTVTPILGDGTEGTPKVMVVEHPQKMDAWQTAAGRARQA